MAPPPPTPTPARGRGRTGYTVHPFARRESVPLRRPPTYPTHSRLPPTIISPSFSSPRPSPLAPVSPAAHPHAAAHRVDCAWRGGWWWRGRPRPSLPAWGPPPVCVFWAGRPSLSPPPLPLNVGTRCSKDGCCGWRGGGHQAGGARPRRHTGGGTQTDRGCCWGRGAYQGVGAAAGLRRTPRGHNVRVWAGGRGGGVAAPFIHPTSPSLPHCQYPRTTPPPPPLPPSIPPTPSFHTTHPTATTTCSRSSHHSFHTTPPPPSGRQPAARRRRRCGCLASIPPPPRSGTRLSPRGGVDGDTHRGRRWTAAALCRPLGPPALPDGRRPNSPPFPSPRLPVAGWRLAAAHRRWPSCPVAAIRAPAGTTDGAAAELALAPPPPPGLTDAAAGASTPRVSPVSFPFFLVLPSSSSPPPRRR